VLRTLCNSKIRCATVTGADLHYVRSITVDPVLVEAADLHIYEQVQVVNVNNGAHSETHVFRGDPGQGEICLNGAAAGLAVPGDTVIYISYAQDEAAELATYHPRFVLVDERNHRTGDGLRAVGT
jgi:aspartate 1-decarboxylase